MKKTTFIIILLLISKLSFSQLFIGINPLVGHFNPSLIGNIQIEKDFGLYGNILYGDVKRVDYFGDIFLVNQFKYGAGISYKLQPDVTFLLGFSNSKFFVKEDTPLINLEHYIYGSVNIGFFVELPSKRKIKLLALTDVNNWESQLGISIQLKQY